MPYPYSIIEKWVSSTKNKICYLYELNVMKIDKMYQNHKIHCEKIVIVIRSLK